MPQLLFIYSFIFFFCFVFHPTWTTLHMRNLKNSGMWPLDMHPHLILVFDPRKGSTRTSPDWSSCLFLCRFTEGRWNRKGTWNKLGENKEEGEDEGFRRGRGVGGAFGGGCAAGSRAPRRHCPGSCWVTPRQNSWGPRLSPRCRPHCGGREIPHFNIA